MGLKTLNRSWLICSLVVLTGCGYVFGDKGVFRDRGEDYKRAPVDPVIAVPEQLDNTALQEIYAIPPGSDEMLLAGEFEVPRPAPLVSANSEDVVRIQRLGEDGWALVNVAPGQLWPQVRAFMATAGLPVVRVDARAGVLETGWLELEGAPMASRFQFRIEQGVQRGTSELHVLQMNQAGDLDSWPTNSDNFEQEQEVLRAVAQFIANSADTAPVSMIADQAIDAEGRISMQETEAGRPYILLRLPADRAWASLARALESSTFEITDRDRSQGRYYVRFLGPQAEEDGGWFGWLFDNDEEHPLAGRQFLIGTDVLGEDTYTIMISPDDDGEPLQRRDEQGLLALIKGNIN